SHRFRNILVSTEIALSLVVLVGAGLLVRSFDEMLRVNPGFNPSRLGFTQIWIPVPNDPTKNPYRTIDKRNAFVAEVLRRVDKFPGVQSAAMGSSTQVPFGGGGTTFRFVFAGEPNTPEMIKRAEQSVVSPEYFATLAAPIKSGRTFADLDTNTAEK